MRVDRARAQIRAYEALVARAAHENWDLSDLEQHLAAAGDVPAENIEACARFWRAVGCLAEVHGWVVWLRCAVGLFG